MPRLVGLIANRPDLCTRFAEHQQSQQKSQAFWRCHRQPEQPWGWGVGFFHIGELLLKRRPLDDRMSISLHEMLNDIRSDIFVAQVRHAPAGTHRTDNTHPFRYREWMFANTGDVSDFEAFRPKLLESLPEFLRRSVRGDTDSELVFHLFLSFLHDAGHLDRQLVPPADVFSAIKATLSLLDRMAKQAKVPEPQLNLLLATPDHLIAAQRGRPMAYRLLVGREAFAPLYAEDSPERLRLPDLESCRLAVVASDFEGEPPAGWTTLPDKAMIALTRTDEPTIVEAR